MSHPLTQSTGGGYEAETSALIARFTTPPTAARAVQINTLIKALKTAGIWSKFDCLWVMAAADSQAARRNWIADLYNLTAVNSPAFSADRGYTGNGSSSRLITGYTPATHGVQLLQDDGSLWLWSRTAAQGASPDIGSIATSPQTRLTLRSATDLLAVRVSDGVTGTTANTDGSGFHGGQRRDATAVRHWRNGVQIGSGVTASTGRSTDEQWLLGANTGNFSTKEQSIAAYGAALTGLEAALYSALNTYMQAVGAA